MSRLAWLYERFAQNRDAAFMVYRDRTFPYSWLLENVRGWEKRLDEQGVNPGAIVALRGDYSPFIVAALLALIERAAIIVPLSPSVASQEREFLEIAEVQWVVSLGDQGLPAMERVEREPRNRLNLELIGRGSPGLVLFSSGSTGASKAALHDFLPLLEKFRKPRRRMTTLCFLMIDHIGGVNTLFSVLSNGGAVVTCPSRDADAVCGAIARHKVELLPTSPTFLNLLLLSEAYRNHDLSSLQLITYGTETMPRQTLERLARLFPNVALQQTYGLSELGILRSKSESSDSLWVKVGGEGFETKISGGTFWIRAKSAMLGYLNAPSPFDAEGWFNTGDVVEVRGDYVRFLGRESEIVNVGGRKVYPAEVEEVLLAIPNVRDVTVCGEPNPLTGNIVTARFNLFEAEDPVPFKRRVREYCRSRMESFKIPARIEIVQDDQFSGRFKKLRRRVGPS